MRDSNSDNSGVPLRALAMVLIALAVVFIGLGLVSLRGDDSAAPKAFAPTSSWSVAASG